MRISTHFLRAGPQAAGRAGPARATARSSDIKVVGLRRRIAEKMSARQIAHPPHHLCRGGRCRRGGGSARRAQQGQAPRPAQADAAALPDAGDGEGDRRAARDQRAVRRRGGRDPPAMAASISASPRRRRPGWSCRWCAMPRRATSGPAARSSNRLAEAARAGTATREELSGSTITITSLGAIGGIVTTPVINHPEVAIVGVNKIMVQAGLGRHAVHPAQDDEPLLQLRPSRRRRLGRGGVHPAREGAARNAGDDLRGGMRS